MSYSLDGRIVIGISSRALFDLSFENGIFEREGIKAYCAYQALHEHDILKPGPGFGLVRALLEHNRRQDGRFKAEVIIMSRNSPETSLRIFHSIEHYGLDITRAVLVSGARMAPYLAAFQTDLFLSAHEDDVQSAIDCGIAAGIICTGNIEDNQIIPFSGAERGTGQIRIAFDGDAVLFSDESERIFRQNGLMAFEENERSKADTPLNAGPFARFLKKLSEMQREYDQESMPIRTALVTSRSAPAHERVIRTLRSWDVRIDEAFFLGGISKRDVLKAFGAHIFFDDQMIHAQSAAQAVPSARVPYGNKDTGKRDTIRDEISEYRTG